MCGRFTLRTPVSELSQLFLFDAPSDINLTARFNIAPSQPVPTVRRIVASEERASEERASEERASEERASEERASEEREFATPRWGLVPSWAKDRKIGAKAINARSETVATRPMFRAAFRRRRCLVLADGYYEWTRERGEKQPYFIRLSNDGPFAMAGLWERWTDPDDEESEPLQTCAILTTEANELTRPLHDRMPVILRPEDHQRWLGVDQEVDSLKELLRPYSSQQMTAGPVSKFVNDVKHEGRQCVQPAASLF